MKKNLMSVIILALVLVNLVLTALLIFSVLPQTKKANELIDKVCKAIDLDLASGAATGVSTIPVDQRESYVLNPEKSMTINLKKGEDGKTAFAVVKISFTMNNKSEGYTKYGSATLSAQSDAIMGKINTIIGSYTEAEYSQLRDTEISDRILEYMQETYGADFIVAVNFQESLTTVQ